MRASGQSSPVEVEDAEIIRRAQNGDASAFEQIYRKHSNRIYSVCMRMVHDPADAEDFTQEAFMQLFRKIHTFRGDSAFSTWLYRLAFNVVLMRLRKKRLDAVSIDGSSDSDEKTHAQPIDVGEADVRLAGLPDRIRLDKAVEQLPYGYREMFLLHDVEGFEHNEIAAILGCSIGNSKSQLHKARVRLRQILRGAFPRKRRPRGESSLAVSEAKRREFAVQGAKA